MTRSGQRGVAIIEFALILPLLLMLMLIAAEFGRAVYEYHILTKSVRNAARFISVQRRDTYVDETRNLIVYGDPFPAADAAPIARGLSLDPDLVPGPAWTTAGSAPVINIVTVQIGTGGDSGVRYVFRPLINSFFGIDFPTIEFPVIQATMRSPLV